MLTEQFNSNGFVHLKDFLDNDNCKQLVQALKDIVASGKTTKDVQCPKSEAIHGHPTFDSLLEQLIPQFEFVSGKRLYPTYAYARLYRRGEKLEIHRDREACEISATLTLGFEGTPWDIYMGDEADGSDGVGITMKAGDAVLYRGCDKYHWRDEFEGEWQAQVFLHYVDADGANANQKFDGRGSLSHNKKEESLFFWSLPDAFPVESLLRIIQNTEGVEGVDGEIGGDKRVVNKDIRDVKRIQMPWYKGVGATMAGIALQANQEMWKFDIKGSDQCEFLRYTKEGRYTGHIDTILNRNEVCRKLTTLLFLNDDFEGGKLFLQISDKKFYPPQEPGSVLVFPSFILHGVEPVTKGVRRSIVTWMVGDWFK